MEFNIGDKVTAIYKTGHYYGEVTKELPTAYTVRVLAIKKHPIQGDLHNPKDAEVGFFHERKALAHREQANIPKKMVKPFDGEMPDYKKSLVTAFNEMKASLDTEDSAYAKRSLECLESLRTEYGI
ncbi:kinase-associated lipoprotein B [Bacillus carboniphilus]|uniref:Kinase-associated lipoprotein B n=1 Tax=Bacillus carboniphilus TaxID=86663 RepID=A0ABN0W645_9BACI